MIRMWGCNTGEPDLCCDATDPCENAAELGCGWVEFADLAALLDGDQWWFGCEGWGCERRVGDDYVYDDAYSCAPGRKPQWLPSRRNDGTGHLFCSTKCLRHTKAGWARTRRAERDWKRCVDAFFGAGIQSSYHGLCGWASGSQMLPRGEIVTATYTLHATLGCADSYVSANGLQWQTATGAEPLTVGATQEHFDARRAALRAWVDSDAMPGRGQAALWDRTQAELGLLARWAAIVEGQP